MMFLLRVICDEVMEKMNKENQVNLKCRIGTLTKTAPYNDVYGCIYIFDVCQLAYKGNASVSFSNARTQTTSMEPILHKTY